MTSLVAGPTIGVPHAGAATSIGVGRSVNEDSFACGPDWYAVADGIGGHRAGALASRIAIEVVRTVPVASSVGEVRSTVARANTCVRETAVRESAIGMGATLVAATGLDGGVAIVGLGDSRCYRLLDGTLTLVTRDHSLVQEWIELGRLARAEAQHHPLRHVVTRALGPDVEVRPDVRVLRAPVGRLLLCSDGLSSELPPRSIGRVLRGIPDPQGAAERLVALASGGADDATAVVVDGLGGGR